MYKKRLDELDFEIYDVTAWLTKKNEAKKLVPYHFLFFKKALY